MWYDLVFSLHVCPGTPGKRIRKKKALPAEVLQKVTALGFEPRTHGLKDRCSTG